ncbi:sigma-70 family RNA polymerase sigma factor [Psychrobacillus sp. FSL K6-2836]|uniref:sigma-70 family RNA polymerase sigma factor n=1 Tax=Psychrobacillus sp. FSL K6-2836 TaxID=2921548 RepID=UPI0030F6DB4C
MMLYGQDLLQLVYTYVKDKALAQDLTQEIFVKCYEAYPTYKGKSTLKTWMWRIAINHCKDYLKSWYNQNIQVAVNAGVDVQASSNVEQQVIQQDEQERLAKTVMQLPIKYREVIYLFYFEDYTSKEIAVMLSINENTVKTRLRKAKQFLKEQLEVNEWI